MRRGTWRSWLPLLLLILSILLLILHETRALASVESALQLVIAPLQRGVTGLVEGAGDLFQTVREVRQLRAEVEELRQQVDALTAENVRLREYQAEVEELRYQHNFVIANPTWSFLGADVVGRSACLVAPCGEVIGQETNPYLRTVSINAGSAERVAVGMPVVTRGAVLVGRVAESDLHTSRVELLNDPSSSVAVFMQQSRATGLLVGQADGSLRVIYIPQEDTLQVGDIVLTSGIGGALPRGLVVGQVTEVIQQDFALFQEAVVRPAVDYRQMELVLVITSFEPLMQEEPTAEGQR